MQTVNDNPLWLVIAAVGIHLQRQECKPSTTLHFVQEKGVGILSLLSRQDSFLVVQWCKRADHILENHVV